MVSKILLRLIDEAIVPAILVISVKILGMFAVTKIFGYTWSLDLTSFFGLKFESHEALLAVNSYSNLLVLIVLAAGLLWIIIRAVHFHETHISPRLALRLFSWDLSHLVVSSVDVYHQAVVWLSYLWLFVVLGIVHAATGMAYGWTAAIGFTIAAFFTWLVISDLEREVLS